MKRATWLAGICGVAWITAPAYWQPPQRTEGPAAVNAVSLRIMFGLRASAPKEFDGEITLSAGRVLRIEGVRFEDSDAVVAENGWTCRTRETEYTDALTKRDWDTTPSQAKRLIPNGVVATLDAPLTARVQIRTKAGAFGFSLGELSLARPLTFLDGDASVELLPAVSDLPATGGEDDYPALTADSQGRLWASWISYANRADAVWVSRHAGNGWEEPVRVSPPELSDNFRTALAEDGRGRLWVIWSARKQDVWGLFARHFDQGKWSEVQPLTGAEGPNLYLAATRGADGRVHVAWQGFRKSKSEILLRTWDGEHWSPEVQVSAGPSDNWAPAVAADPGGDLWIGWDSYDAGNFDIYVRRLTRGRLEAARRITRSPLFEANVSLACDRERRLWMAWDVAEPNWGKDWTSQHFRPQEGNGLYRTRAVRVACLEGAQLRQPADIMQAIPPAQRDYFQMVQLQPDRAGRIWAVGRMLGSYRKRVQNNWGMAGLWEVTLTALEGDRWLPAVKLASTAGRNDVRVAVATAASGELWLVWSRDGRSFRRVIPQQTRVSCARLTPSGPAGPLKLEPLAEPAAQARPVHPDEPANVAAIRSYRYRAGGKEYRILRGDLHRHTDISADGIGDGSLLDLYRYAFSAGQYDFMLVADHQYGNTEYNWWRTEKSEDAFYVPGRFWPLFGTERSVPYPNGHRNTIFARRGVRELPITPGERNGTADTGPILYPYLRKFGGLATSHSTATDQGTDWRDSDPELEPIVELYQGLHASYEYEGAPRAETPEKRYIHHGVPWRPAGFIWNAWAKGLKLGVQASSDHIATHDSYACVLVEGPEVKGREALLDAMRRRHTYAATDNIILDVRIGEHLMGDAFSTADQPVLKVMAQATGPISRIEVIKNNTFVYTAQPAGDSARFEFRDDKIQRGESYYYVRLMQRDGQLAWSSPIWVNYTSR